MTDKSKWSAREARVLHQLWGQLPRCLISERIGRSITAVGQRAYRDRITAARVKWSPDDIAELRRLDQIGAGYQLEGQVRRSRKSVECMLRRIRRQKDRIS